jgi:glycosyltransferase domain-containing protein
MRNMTMLDYTLVIPTFNRPKELRALLRYYQTKGNPFPILVLESSSDPEALVNNNETISGHDGVASITFDPQTNLAAKVAEGLNSVSTRFASLCADDDVVFVKGLELAIDELREDGGLVAAHGVYFNFKRKDDDPLALNVAVEYQKVNPNAGRVGARLMQMGLHYESQFYAVFETDCLKTVFDKSAQLDSLHYQELFQAFSATMLGRSVRLDVPYAGRHSGPAAEPDRENWQTYDWFAEDPKAFLTSYVVYRQALLDFYCDNKGEPLPNDVRLSDVLDMAHATYFTQHIHPTFFFTKTMAGYPDVPYQDWSDFALIHSAASELNKTAGAPVNLVEKIMYRTMIWLNRRFDERKLAEAEAAFSSCEQYFSNAVESFDRLVLDDQIHAACRLEGHLPIKDALVELGQYCDIRDKHTEV